MSFFIVYRKSCFFLINCNKNVWGSKVVRGRGRVTSLKNNLKEGNLFKNTLKEGNLFKNTLKEI